MERFKQIVGMGVLYNIIEVTLVVIVGVVHWSGAQVYPWFLWLAFSAAALWTILASTRESQDDVQGLVMNRVVIYTDFLIGAFLLLTLSTMTLRYGLQFGVIFFVAAIQNLKYSVMAYNWIAKEDHARD